MKPLLLLSLVFMPVSAALHAVVLVKDGVQSWTK